MDVREALTLVQPGQLRSYTWLARRIGLAGPQAARAAGQAIAKETLRLFPTPEADAAATHHDFPWWRIIGAGGEVRTVSESLAWHARQVLHLQGEGHVLVPAQGSDGLKVAPLPAGFE